MRSLTFGPLFQPPCVTFLRVAGSLQGPGQSPVLPLACCVGSLCSDGHWPAFLLVPFLHWRSPVVGPLGLCWLLRGSFYGVCCPPPLRTQVVHQMPHLPPHSLLLKQPPAQTLFPPPHGLLVEAHPLQYVQNMHPEAHHYYAHDANPSPRYNELMSRSSPMKDPCLCPLGTRASDGRSGAYSRLTQSNYRGRKPSPHAQAQPHENVPRMGRVGLLAGCCACCS